MRSDFVADISGKNLAAAGDEIHLQHGIDFGQLKFRQLQWKEQPLLLARALLDGLCETDLLVVILKIVEFHALSQFSCARRVGTAYMDEAFIILQIVLLQPVRHTLRCFHIVANREQRRA